MSQFVSSCFCGCEDAVSYNVIYTDLSVEALNTAGFSVEPVNESAHKIAFGLSISVLSETALVSEKRNGCTFEKFGFNRLYACSCPNDSYLRDDPVDRVEIWLEDKLANESYEVTDWFSYSAYNEESIPFSELFENLEPWHDYYQVQLTNFDEMPSNVVFTINATLSSGIVYTSKTQDIEFI